jgi:hypothetical protein
VGILVPVIAGVPSAAFPEACDASAGGQHALPALLTGIENPHDCRVKPGSEKYILTPIRAEA